MQKTIKIFTVILFAVLCVGVSSMAEEITLTTYYPAPYGVYEELTVTGNIGIGTTSPQASLDLGDHDGDIRIYDANGTAHILGDEDNGESDGIVLRTLGNPGSGEAIFVVESSGNSQRLRVEHNGYLSTTNALYVSGTGDSYIAGELGIGITSPSYTLEVNGTIRSTGKGTFTGGIDPPYISFTSESHESIREYAKDVEEHEKVMQFWNGDAHRLEVYVIVDDKFYTITGELIEE